MSPGPGTPDVFLGGRGYVSIRNEQGSESLWPVDRELTPEDAEEHCRRASAVMARQIEKGTAPWMRPRSPGHPLPENLADGQAHRGLNAVWLQAAADYRGFADPRWGTRAEIAEAGGQVRPGEEATTMLAHLQHWQTGNSRVFALPVFNAEQCDGIDPVREDTPWRPNPPRPQEILDQAAIRHDTSARPHYDPDTDAVILPPPREGGMAAYLREGLRQVGHWTGHPSRLARESFSSAASGAGSARETLRGEIHALLAGCRLSLGHKPHPNPPRKAWARALRADPHEILRAADDAERMLEFTADRARAPRPMQEQAPPRDAPRPLADLARQILAAPPWERAR